MGQILKIASPRNTTDCVSLSVADTGHLWGRNMHLGDFSETAHQTLPLPLPTTPSALSTTAPSITPTTSRSAVSTPVSSAGPPNTTPSTVPRLKRLNNAQQHNVYTLCQTAEGAMKFRCTECNRCFNLKCTLLRHVRHQHQGRFVPHPCGQCGQVFKRTDHLKVHMRKIHKMTSVSRSNRGQNSSGGGGGGSIADASAVASADAAAVLPLGPMGTPDSAFVAAAVAQMANTQPLALTTKDESDGDSVVNMSINANASIGGNASITANAISTPAALLESGNMS